MSTVSGIDVPGVQTTPGVLHGVEEIMVIEPSSFCCPREPGGQKEPAGHSTTLTTVVSMIGTVRIWSFRRFADNCLINSDTADVSISKSEFAAVFAGPKCLGDNGHEPFAASMGAGVDASS